VEIDGQPFGGGKKTSGGQVALPPGTHTFTISVPDFPARIITREITTSTGTVALNLDLGWLTVMGDPAIRLPGGEVFIDGDKIGRLPLIRKKVSAGKHELVVRWPGSEKTFRRNVEIPQAPAEFRMTVAPGGG
jgi:hypothetical protein